MTETNPATPASPPASVQGGGKGREWAISTAYWQKEADALKQERAATPAPPADQPSEPTIEQLRTRPINLLDWNNRFVEVSLDSDGDLMILDHAEYSIIFKRNQIAALCKWLAAVKPAAQTSDKGPIGLREQTLSVEAAKQIQDLVKPDGKASEGHYIEHPCDKDVPPDECSTSEMLRRIAKHMDDGTFTVPNTFDKHEWINGLRLRADQIEPKFVKPTEEVHPWGDPFASATQSAAASIKAADADFEATQPRVVIAPPLEVLDPPEPIPQGVAAIMSDLLEAKVFARGTYIDRKYPDGYPPDVTREILGKHLTQARAPLAEELRPRIVCLCGSTRFIDAFHQAEFRETLAGRIVLTIGCDTKSDGELFKGPEGDAIKVRLDKLHKCKIDIADEILVLDVGGYIGQSTRSEIQHAELHGVPVRYLSQESDSRADWEKERDQFLADRDDPKGELKKAREEIERLRRVDRMALQTIRDRDANEECINKIYRLVTGESPEWSSNFGHAEAVDMVEQTMYAKDQEIGSAMQERDAAIAPLAEEERSELAVAARVLLGLIDSVCPPSDSQADRVFAQFEFDKLRAALVNNAEHDRQFDCLRKEYNAITRLSKQFDEFNRVYDPECELPQLADHVHRIIGGLCQERDAAIKAMQLPRLRHMAEDVRGEVTVKGRVYLDYDIDYGIPKFSDKPPTPDEP